MLPNRWSDVQVVEESCRQQGSRHPKIALRGPEKEVENSTLAMLQALRTAKSVPGKDGHVCGTFSSPLGGFHYTMDLGKRPLKK